MFDWLEIFSPTASAATIPLVTKVTEQIINPIISFFFVLGVVYFFWGMAEFFWKSDSKDGRDIGKKHMLSSVIGLFIMVAVYGLLNLIKATIAGIGT